MLLCRLVISFAVCLQPPRILVLFRGVRHFAHVGVGPCFLLHLCTWTPQATSSESLRALYGAVKYPWMLWSAKVYGVWCCRSCCWCGMWRDFVLLLAYGGLRGGF